MVAHRQLIALGFTPKAIKHRLTTGRLHRLRHGVYAVGRKDLNRKGRWMAAVLACGEDAFLTHRSAGALYGICVERPGRIEVGVPRPHGRSPEDIRLRRRASLPSKEVGSLHRIPITSPAQTMIDLATELPTKYLLRAVNEADKLEVIRADDLRDELDAYRGVPGAKRLVALLDRDTFVLTQEELERLFLPLAREVGLPLPITGETVNGYELVVETDGLRLRFSQHQVKHERAYVKRILGETAGRLA